MNEIAYALSIDWDKVGDQTFQLAVAFILSLPIAWNREEKSRGAGLRTFPLVCIASCAYMLVGKAVFPDPEAQARIMYGIITGMGFIGGGAILKTSSHVAGTATAAALWNTGAIGVSVAQGQYEIAVLLSLVSFLIFMLIPPIKHMSNGHHHPREPGGPDG
ncbi:MgtC/SapB family protein [Allohahella marinimesophila]|uniref:Protein MgtC n=1 Tax=Allohahella marinimesophila TaxID=1054972 RepID=A0ABP7PMS5_9GAMM